MRKVLCFLLCLLYTSFACAAPHALLDDGADLFTVEEETLLQEFLSGISGAKWNICVAVATTSGNARDAAKLLSMQIESENGCLVIGMSTAEQSPALYANGKAADYLTHEMVDEALQYASADEDYSSGMYMDAVVSIVASVFDDINAAMAAEQAPNADDLVAMYNNNVNELLRLLQDQKEIVETLASMAKE